MPLVLRLRDQEYGVLDVVLEVCIHLGGRVRDDPIKPWMLLDVLDDSEEIAVHVLRRVPRIVPLDLDLTGPGRVTDGNTGNVAFLATSDIGVTEMSNSTYLSDTLTAEFHSLVGIVSTDEFSCCCNIA